MIYSNQSPNRALEHLQANTIAAYNQQMAQHQQQYSQALWGASQNAAIGVGPFQNQAGGFQNLQPVSMMLYDANGGAIFIMVDPQVVPYIDAINRHHQAITRPAMAMTPRSIAEPMPNSEFSLDEMTKAEELLEELNVGAHD